MKYKCLVFDHDDTVVDSTRCIHYPSFVDYMKTARPGLTMSLEEYVALNFDPGFMYLFKEVCKLSDEELKDEYDFWLRYCDLHTPRAFDGIREIMEAHRAAGGILTVVSHSESGHIRKDYRSNRLPEPDLVFGIDEPEDERKPSPVPLYKIMEQYRLAPSDLLVIDDLKPGLTMARAAGVPFCAAGWCFDIPENTAYMKEHADCYCGSVAALKELLEY